MQFVHSKQILSCRFFRLINNFKPCITAMSFALISKGKIKRKVFFILNIFLKYQHPKYQSPIFSLNGSL